MMLALSLITKSTIAVVIAWFPAGNPKQFYLVATSILNLSSCLFLYHPCHMTTLTNPV